MLKYKWFHKIFTSLISVVRRKPFCLRIDHAISVSLTFIWQPYVSK